LKLDVNPTRMELLRLRKRVVLARRGHKLLKDKQDELLRQLMELVKVVADLRKIVEKRLQESSQRFLLARASMDPESLEEALLIPAKKLSVAVRKRNLMSVRVPVFERSVSGEIHSYGFANTSGELDVSLVSLDEVLDELLSLSEKEKTLFMLAAEVDKTRRRVNALEYILIPSLDETIRNITMKLAEMERGNVVRLMRVKEVVRKKR
jgi:V/A-type H+-transporting ATPase subunit D